jgi:hypothetical protein
LGDLKFSGTFAISDGVDKRDANEAGERLINAVSAIAAVTINEARVGK